MTPRPASASAQTAEAEAIANAAPAVDLPAPNVIEALRRVMRDLPAIGRDQTASAQQGGYAYRGIEQITKHTQGLFARHGIVFVPRVVHHEVRDLMVNNKPWTDTVELVEYDVFGPGGAEDRITVGPILAIGRDNSDKGANKCMTQAFKYALLQTLCISDAKDDSDGQTHEADAPAAPWNVNQTKAHLLHLLGDSAAAKEAWTAGKGDEREPGPELAERLADEWRANQPKDDPAPASGEPVDQPGDA